MKYVQIFFKRSLSVERLCDINLLPNARVMEEDINLKKIVYMSFQTHASIGHIHDWL